MKLEVVQGDITKISVDAVVNAANSALARGSGVCGAIFAAAGPGLDEECAKLGGCATGDAVTTSAHNMKTTKWIIHAVGPIYDQDPASAPRLLESAYAAIIRECAKNDIRSVAIPCISTGIYGYPKKEAAEIAVATVKKHIGSAPTLERVIFCCFSIDDFEYYSKLLS